MVEYKLTYFDIKGLAEPIRILFAVANVPYEDIRVSYDPEAGASLAHMIPPDVMKKLPYGEMPILEQSNGVILSQSHTIGRYLACKFNLMGADEIEAAQIDEITDARRDYGEKFRDVRLAKSPEDKTAAIQHIKEVAAPKYLGKFSEILERNGGKYFVGRGMSWADIQMFHWLTYVGHKLHDENFIKEYPALNNFVQNMEAHPRIQEWLQKRPKTHF